MTLHVSSHPWAHPIHGRTWQLFAYDEAALHLMAFEIGTNRWCPVREFPYYEIDQTQRMLAMALGVVELDSLAVHEWAAKGVLRTSLDPKEWERADRVLAKIKQRRHFDAAHPPHAYRLP